MSYGNFDKLENIYVIEFRCKAKTPISVRAGRSYMDTVDNPVVRIHYNGKQMPYIPGSSIKGSLRALAEQLSRSIYGDDSVCNILNPNGDNGELKRRDKMGKDYVPCIVCRVFGGPTIASHLVIYNSMSLEEKTHVIRRVTINRVTGGQHGGKLFEVEYINPGIEFEMKMELRNLDIMSDSDEAKLFNLLFKYIMDFGIRVGGLKSVGYGLLEPDKKSIRIRKIYVEDGEIMDKDVTEEYLEFIGVRK